MFREIEKGTHGETVYCEDPKIEAYKSAAYIQNILGRNYRIISNADNSYTVEGDGLLTITYERG